MNTVPLTARKPRSYTPPFLKARYETAAGLYDEQLRAHSMAVAANEGKAAAEPKVPDPGHPGEKPQLPIFFLAVPTALERSQIGTLMFELGVIQITRETVRNAVLEECFTLHGDEKGEELALFLEDFWQRQQAYEEDSQLWAQQERQRLIDGWHGGVQRDPYEMPRQRTGLKDRLRAKREVDAIIEKSQTVRRVLGAQQDYGRANAEMLIRVHLRGWQGLRTQREAVNPGESGQPPAELLTLDCASALLDEIGPQAWDELFREIDNQYGLTPEEVGNSDLPPVSEPTPDGSGEASEGQDGSSGGPSPGTKKGNTK